MLNLYRYRLPFKRPFITGAGTFEHREGLIIRYCNSDIDVVSEVAPLPGFSKESLRQTEIYLSSKRKQLSHFFDRHFTASELNSWLNTQSVYPSVDFGLSSLGLSILSVRQKKRLHSVLNLSPASYIKVNAVLGESDEASFLSQARKLITKGFKVLKCKVTASPGHLPHSLETLSKQHQGTSFRLDANRSWPVNDVSELSSRFRNLPVEYIEEPCSVDTIGELDSIIRDCNLPVAADETLVELGMQTVLNQTKTIPYLIIKPTLCGNLMDIFATLGTRTHLQDRMIFTTALESAVGTRMIASVTAMTGSRTTAHGLNTGSLFRLNLTDDDSITGGTFQVQQNFKSWYSFQSINQSLLTLLR